MSILQVALLFGLIVIVKCQEKACKTQADCDQLQCCASIENRRSGIKRFIFSSKSVCKPRRYQGQACHVYIHHDFSNPNVFLDYCPCEDGLECRGTTIDGQVHHNPKCLPIVATTDSVTTTPQATTTTLRPMTTSQPTTSPTTTVLIG